MFKTCKKPPMSIISASGDICSFKALQAGIPLKSHVVQLTATQSGSGTPSPQNIRSINGWTEVNIVRCGKNLIDIPNIEVNGAISPYVFSGKSGVTYCVSFDADVSGVGINAQFRSSDNASIIAQAGINTSDSSRNIINITLPDNSYKFRFYSAGRINISNVQIAIGSNNSSYEAYNGTYTTIQIGSTVYGGEYDARTGVLTVTHGFDTYDGSEDETWDAFNIDLRMGVRGRTTANKSYVDSNISNIFINSPSNETYVEEANLYTWRSSPYVSNLVFFYVPLSENISTVEQWRTWLSNHPTTICYKLATPQTIQLPPCPIDTLEGVNNVFADCGATSIEAFKFGR